LRTPIILASVAALALVACDSGPFNRQNGTAGAASAVTDAQARQLREALRGAVRHGLTPDLFFKGDLEKASGDQLRGAALAYASALAMGKVDPKSISEVYTLPQPKVDVKAGFDKALAGNRLLEWLDTLPGNGFRLKKFRYEVVPGLWLPGLLYEPAQLSGRIPAIVNLNTATQAQLESLPGIGPRTAEAIKAALADQPGRPRTVSLNTATGEIEES